MSARGSAPHRKLSGHAYEGRMGSCWLAQQCHAWSAACSWQMGPCCDHDACVCVCVCVCLVSETGPPWVTADHPLEPLELAVRLGCDCQACGSHCRLPIITPCGHMLCLPCTLKDRCSCHRHHAQTNVARLMSGICLCVDSGSHAEACSIVTAVCCSCVQS